MKSSLSRRWTVLLAIVVAGAAPATAVAAKPHVTGSFAVPKGLSIGGFASHGLVDGPDGALWMTTGTSTAKKPVLLRISAAGRVSSVKVPVPGGIDFFGLGVGPDHHIWFSGAAAGGTHRGYRGRVVGHTVQMKEAADSATWSALATLGSLGYAVDGFSGVQTSSDAETFAFGGMSNASAWDVGALNGTLFFIGDDGAGSFVPGAPGATLFSSPEPLSGRSMTIAGGAMWFLQGTSNAPNVKLGEASVAGAVSLHPLPAPGVDAVTGPDGNPWVLTQHSLLRIAADGSISAKVKLPAGERGILVSPGPAHAVWVATLTKSGQSRVIRIAVS
jgi:hypothetical protein